VAVVTADALEVPVASSVVDCDKAADVLSRVAVVESLLSEQTTTGLHGFFEQQPVKPFA
jgi:hypothetical protein